MLDAYQGVSNGMLFAWSGLNSLYVWLVFWRMALFLPFWIQADHRGVGNDKFSPAVASNVAEVCNADQTIGKQVRK